MFTFEYESCNWGYHVYQTIFGAAALERFLTAVKNPGTLKIPSRPRVVVNQEQ